MCAAGWRFALLLSLLLGAARSSAQTPPPSPGAATVASPAPARAEILLVVVGSEHEFSRLREAVATWRLGEAELSWHRSTSFRPRSLLEASGATPRIRCFIDLSSGATVRLYFANETTQRFMVRNIETSGRLDEMDREALAQAIELSLLSLLEDRAAGLSRKDTESLLGASSAPEPTPAARSSAPPRPVAPAPFERWELGVSYGAVQLLAGPVVAHGPGISLAHVFLGEPRALVFARGQYGLPAQRSERLAGVELQATALRLGAEVAPKLFAWNGGAAEQRLALRLGAGVDLVQVEPTNGDVRLGATVTEPRQRIDPALSAGAEALTLLPGGLTLRAGLSIEFSPNEVSYDVDIDGNRHALFRSLRLRPGAMVGVGIRIP